MKTQLLKVSQLVSSNVFQYGLGAKTTQVDTQSPDHFLFKFFSFFLFRRAIPLFHCWEQVGYCSKCGPP